MCDNAPSSSASSTTSTPGSCHTHRSSLDSTVPSQLRTVLKSAKKRIEKNLGLRDNLRRGDFFVPSQAGHSGNSPNAPYPNLVPPPDGRLLYPYTPMPNQTQNSPTPPQLPSTRPPPFPPRYLDYGWNVEQYSSTPSLRVDTMGGETAGSGMGYVGVSSSGADYQNLHPTPYNADLYNDNHIIRAQITAMNVVKAQIEQVRHELGAVTRDVKEINDFIPTAYPYEIDIATNSNKMLALDNEIARLERELHEMRQVHPSAVPPPRPPRPAQQTWKCLKCSESNVPLVFRCTRCSFPRPEIDPKETKRCGCEECNQSPRVQHSVRLVPAEGGDWTLVNRMP